MDPSGKVYGSVDLTNNGASNIASGAFGTDSFGTATITDNFILPPGITTLTDGALVILTLSGEDNNNAAITTTGTDPSGYNERYIESAVGADAMFGYSDANRSTAGPTGNVSENFDVAVPIAWGAWLLSLKPPPPPTTAVKMEPGFVVRNW